MKLSGRDKASAFKAKHADARASIDTWISDIEEAKWATPHEMKQIYPKADPVGGMNTIFNLNHNKYRLWALINYVQQTVMIKAVGTHKEYEKWKIK